MYLQYMLTALNTNVIYTLQTKQICCRLSIKAADSCGSNSLDLDKPQRIKTDFKHSFCVYIKNGKTGAMIQLQCNLS